MSLLTLIIERCGTHSEGFEKLCGELTIPSTGVTEFPAQFPGHPDPFGVSVSTGKHPLELGLYLPGEFAFERGTLRPYARHDLPVAHGWEAAVEKVWTVNWPGTRDAIAKPGSVFIAPEFIFPSGISLSAWPVPIGGFHGITCAQAEMLRLHPSDLQENDLEGLPHVLSLKNRADKYLVVLRALALITSIQNFARYFRAHYSDRDGFIQWPFFSLLESVLREESQEIKNELYFIAGLYLKNLTAMFDDVIIIGQGFDVAPQQQQLSMAFYYASNHAHKIEHIAGAQDINALLKQRLLPELDSAKQAVVSGPAKLISKDLPATIQAQAYLCKAEMERAVHQEEAAWESYFNAHRLAPSHPLVGFRAVQQSLELGKWQQAGAVLAKFEGVKEDPGFRVLALFLSVAKEEKNAQAEIGVCDTALQMQIASLICKSQDKAKAVTFYEKVRSCLTNDFIHAMALSEIRQIPQLNVRFASLVDKFPSTALTTTIKLQLMNEAMARGNMADLVRYNP